MLDTRDKFYAFLDNLENKHCLMFVEEEKDGTKNEIREFIDASVERAQAVFE